MTEEQHEPEAAEPAPAVATPEAPAPRSRKGPMIGLVVALIAATAGAGGWLLLSRSGGGAETPRAAIEGYYEGLGSGDCAATAAYVDPSFASEQEVCAAFDESRTNAGTLVAIGEVDQRGDQAFVITTRTAGGITDDRIVTVNDVDGSWKLAGGNACWGPENPQDLGNDHLAEGETYTGYSSMPPASGPHAPTPTETGTIYESPQPHEELVHAMEHGAVVFWTSGMDDALQQHAEDSVIDVFNQGYESLIMTPDTLDDPFTMTAWGVVQRCVGVSASEIQEFVDTHYGSGMEGMMACFGDAAAALPGCRDQELGF